ncbi:Trimeric GatFAB AmidoTransferase(AdT) complex subunit [Ascosphaera aggregata]|nr:Trimeric GatFAB AmidoTransferase(AdT) complex subunit [Ascosphaera aggregata]
MSLIRQAERCFISRKAYANLNAFIAPLQDVETWRSRVADAEVRRKKGASIPGAAKRNVIWMEGRLIEDVTGQLRSALDGKVIAVKDNICTQQLTTTCASKILENFTSPFNATIVQRLEDAGAVIAGKTNMDEFGMGSHSLNSHFGRVVNQLNADKEPLSAGGSSGGSAVAVATDQCYAALGTDTGGSVRLPASYTGIIGFKPSYGLLSRWGVVAYANSLDTVGVLGKTIPVVKGVFDTLNHYDPRDPTSLSPATRSRIARQATATSQTHRRSNFLRIGVPLEYNIAELTQPVRSAWLATLRTLQSQGHFIHPVSLPTTRHALASYYVLAPAEASSNLAKYDGVRYGYRDASKPDDTGGLLYAETRGVGFGEEVKRRILLGAFTLSADAMDNYFVQAQKARRLVQRDFNQCFASQHPLLYEGVHPEDRASSVVDGNADMLAMTSDNSSGNDKVDVLVCPTAPSLPPTLKSLEEQSPLQAYVNDVFTVPASLAGLPALSVPVSAEEELPAPVGMQVIGQYGDDGLVLDVGEIIHNLQKKLDCNDE